MRKPRAKPPAPQPSPEEITIQHVPVSDLKACYADGVTIGQVADQNGAVLQLAFTRIDMSVLSESFSAIKNSETFRQVSPPKFEQPLRKSVEAMVLMRPDHAVQLAAGIMTAYQKLPQSLKERFPIPMQAQSALSRQESDE